MANEKEKKTSTDITKQIDIFSILVEAAIKSTIITLNKVAQKSESYEMFQKNLNLFAEDIKNKTKESLAAEEEKLAKATSEEK